MCCVAGCAALCTLHPHPCSNLPLLPLCPQVSVEVHDRHPVGQGPRWATLEATLAAMLALAARAELTPAELSPPMLLTLLWMAEAWNSQYSDRFGNWLSGRGWVGWDDVVAVASGHRHLPSKQCGEPALLPDSLPSTMPAPPQDQRRPAHLSVLSPADPSSCQEAKARHAGLAASGKRREAVSGTTSMAQACRSAGP